MSGWIKMEKEIREDRRFTRMVDAMLAQQNATVTSVTQMRFVERGVVTQVLGSLAQLWMFADSHIREDDTLDITLDEIDQLVGVEGFAKLMPSDWLEVLDENRVRLPDFQAHNGTDAKRKALTAKRVKRHRTRTAVSDVTPEKRESVTDALPDQTRLDQTRPDQRTLVGESADADPPTEHGSIETLQGSRSNRGWPKDLHDQIIATYHEVLPDLPAVRDWPERRRRKLDARISERLKAGKQADKPDYWRALFTNVQASDFLCGRKGDWRCPGLEWLLEPKNFTKVIEGSYRNHSGMNGANHAR